MNNNINLNELTAILKEILNRENNFLENNLLNEIFIPVTKEQKTTFAAGYAEGISDVLQILTEMSFNNI